MESKYKKINMAKWQCLFYEYLGYSGFSYSLYASLASERFFPHCKKLWRQQISHFD